MTRSIVVPGWEVLGHKHTTLQKAARVKSAQDRAAKVAWEDFLAGGRVVLIMGAYEGKVFMDRGDARGVWWQK